MHKITIYTDGACSGNPGTGGWAAVLLCGKYSKRICGGEKNTTNNRMELLAVINALECLKQPSSVAIYSDSAYVVNAFTQEWLDNWVMNDWITSNRKPVQNKDLWIRLVALTKKHRVKFIKVKGHSNNTYNEECDKLAKSAINNCL